MGSSPLWTAASAKGNKMFLPILYNHSVSFFPTILQLSSQCICNSGFYLELGSYFLSISFLLPSGPFTFWEVGKRSALGENQLLSVSGVVSEKLFCSLNRWRGRKQIHIIKFHLCGSVFVTWGIRNHNKPSGMEKNFVFKKKKKSNKTKLSLWRLTIYQNDFLFDVNIER